MDTKSVMNYIIRKHHEESARACADDGLNGKAFECAIRSYISGRLYTTVKAQNKTDIRFTHNGKRYTAEIKTACGEIETADKSQYIIYAPYVDTDFPAEFQAYMFTREEWRAFINGYNGRGKFTRTDARGHVHIQSFYVSETIRPKASKAIARYIDSVINEMDTVADFFNR